MSRIELLELSKETGWSIEQLKKGYEIFSADFMSGALHVERLDSIDYFKNDKLASEKAERDGIKIIHDLPINEKDEDFAYYVDTVENRKTISNHLLKRGIIWC